MICRERETTKISLLWVQPGNSSCKLLFKYHVVDQRTKKGHWNHHLYIISILSLGVLLQMSMGATLSSRVWPIWSYPWPMNHTNTNNDIVIQIHSKLIPILLPIYQIISNRYQYSLPEFISCRCQYSLPEFISCRYQYQSRYLVPGSKQTGTYLYQ